MRAEGSAGDDFPDEESLADAALDRFLPPSDVGIVTRSHHVTALLLARSGADWLPRTLAALVDQDRPADVVRGIDASSADASAALIAASGIALVRAPATAPEGPGVAVALAAGVAGASAPTGTAPDEHADDGGPDFDAGPDGGADTDTGPDAGVVAWYWIVHDDSAPEAGALEALLRGADRNPAATVLVPKTVGWSDSGLLVGVGNRWAPGAPVVDPLDPAERDQGQYDVDRPVYSGDSAGMLVRADAWAALDGMDPGVGDWAASADLCRRAWGAGGEVMFIPAAVLAHRQSGHRGVRAQAGVAHPRQAARSGQLILELSQAPGTALAWRYLRGWVATAVRALALLLTREPEEAAAEVAGAWQVLGRAGRIRRARRRLRLPPVTDLTRPPHVRARRGVALGHGLDVWTAARRTTRRRWWPLPAAMWQPLLIAAALAVASFLRSPGQFLGSGTLRGGGLLPAPGAMALLGEYLASWHGTRFGTPLPLPAHLPLLAAASAPLLGSVDALLRLAFGLAVPLAFLSCYVSLGRRIVPRTRLLAALGYCVLPAGVAAAGGGRISTLAVVLLAPPTARLIAVALGWGGRRAHGIRPTIAAGTMLGVVVAFAPVVFPLALVAGTAAWILLGFPGRRLRTGLMILGIAALFLVLWIPRVVGAPWLVLSEFGVADPTLVDPGPAVWGLSPGGPTSIAWAGVPLLVVGLAAVVVARFRTRALALLVAVGGLLAGAAWIGPLASRAWPDQAAASLWPGVLTLLAGALVIALVAGAVDSDAGSVSRAGPVTAGSAGRWTGALSAAWLLAVGVLFLGWWATPSALSVSASRGVPPVVSLEAESPARPRALVLARVPDGLRFAVTHGPAVRLGDAEALAGSSVDPAFDDAVAGLVSGASGEVEQELGGRAIRYVVFNGPSTDPLVAELDATIGLRQLARAAEQSLWLVAGDPTRAELTGSGTEQPGGLGTPPPAPTGIPAVEVPVLTSPSSVDVVLHPQTELPRRLLLAEDFDAGWAGSLAGAGLDLSADAQGMISAEIATTGELRLVHTSWWPYVAGAQLVLFAALLVLSLPKRRPVDPDAEEPAPQRPAQRPAEGPPEAPEPVVLS